MQIHLTDRNVAEQLRGWGLIGADESFAVEPAGDGNINWVRRLRDVPSGRSVIVKQAREALERFPQYQASSERIVFEARYYETAGPVDAAGVCPRVLGFHPDARVLLLEDLGDAERLDDALARGADVSAPAAVIGAFLAHVHRATRDPALAGRFPNGEMRRLHGDHIFELPLRENDFDLAPEVRACADRLRGNAALVAAADAAYARYLEPRGALVHADVQAGNVLLAPRGPVLLDAEIAHVGDPAFDVGTLIAHLLLPALAAGDAGRARIAVIAAWEGYVEGCGGDALAPFRDVARYAGLEMLRRTIGAARVPAVASVVASLAVAEAAAQQIVAPVDDPAALAV